MHPIPVARVLLASMLASSVALAADAPATAPAAQGRAADVPVKAVVLFSSGVGYFEHFGTVQGDGSTELRFKTNQINDILKSLVLQDLDGGKVNTITYPSQDPIAKTLRSFQVDITSNPSLGALLNQLRGAKVDVTMNVNDHIKGTVLGVEKQQKPADDKGHVIETSILNVITNDGGAIMAIDMMYLTSIKLEDAQLQEELNKALLALTQARDQDKKPVTIHLSGQGERHVRIGYVVETPIWKTSYRLILGDKPKLQGWAIVENQTDNDWNDVQLSLVSGRPISFVQDLYQPLYIPRPVVQPELYASLRPQTYEGGMDGKKQVEALAEASEMKADEAEKAAPAAAPRAKRGLRQATLGGAGGADKDGVADSAIAGEQNQPIDPTASVASVASASKIGELFQYTVGNVSLPRQKSAMIPIITDDIEIEKLSIYNASVLPKNPLNGARLKNTTGKHLLAGPITVLDANSYAGDARVDNLPPGQERLLSYGIDLQMTVDSTSNRNESTIQSGKIIKGILQLTRKNVFTQEYLADNKSDAFKTIIFEHPRRAGWTLVDSPKPVETTDALYRFKGKVDPSKNSKLTVKEEIVQGETIAILPADVGQLDFYSKTGEIPKDVRDAIAQAMRMKSAMTDTEREIAERQKQVAEITQDQNRIRDNIRTVQQGAYHDRLLTKLNEQETQLDKLRNEIEDRTKQLQQQRKELEDYLMNLNVG